MHVSVVIALSVVGGQTSSSYAFDSKSVLVEILPDGTEFEVEAVTATIPLEEVDKSVYDDNEYQFYSDDEKEEDNEYSEYSESEEENLIDEDDRLNYDDEDDDGKEEYDDYFETEEESLIDEDDDQDYDEDDDYYEDDDYFGTENEILSKVEPIPINIVTRQNPRPVEIPPYSYGLDISYPVHSFRTSLNFSGYNGTYGAVTYDENDSLPVNILDQPEQPLGDRQSFYLKYMQGCRDFENKEGIFAPASGTNITRRKNGYLCDSTEKDRIRMNKSQPETLANFTDMGFKKMRAPPLLVELLTSFWKENMHKQEGEKWFTGNVYTNHWAAPTRMISLDNTKLKGQAGLKKRVWDAACDAIEEWTGQTLHPVSLYGIRIYPEGAVLAPHVDRLPLVSSAIINIAQDVDEDWPIEVCGHDGKMHNVTMEPGDLVLYESHTVVHGRPFPLKGRFYANVFIHFEPVGREIREYTKKFFDADGNLTTTQIKFEVPKYILPGTKEEKQWHTKGAITEDSKETDNSVADAFRRYASLDDTHELRRLVIKAPEWCDDKDANGWTPLHEAARSGSIENIRILLNEPCKATINAKTNAGTSVYDIAVEYLGVDSATVLYLLEAMMESP